MSIFKRHTKSFIFLGLYFIWCLLVLYYYFSRPKPTMPTCDFSPILIIPISFLMGIIGIIGFSIKSFTSKEQQRIDYIIFLGIVIIPVIIGGFYLVR